MKKFFISLSIGTLAGIALSLALLEYNPPQYIVVNLAEADRVIKEMDFDFVFNSTLLIFAITVNYLNKNGHPWASALFKWFYFFLIVLRFVYSQHWPYAIYVI